MRPWLFVSILIFTGVPVAAADPGQGDAPNSWEAAVDVPLGRFEGSLSGGGDVDWYRVEVPAGSAVKVSIEGTCPFGDTPFGMEIRSDAGVLAHAGTSTCDFLTASITKTIGTGSSMRIGILAGGWSASYDVTLEAIAAPDVSVTSVEWSETAVPSLRTVTGHITGSADHGTLLLSVTAWTTHPQGTGIRELGTKHVTLPPGETAEAEFVWDTAGEIGATEVHVEAIPSIDRDVTNNEGSVRTHVLVENDIGMDPLNTDASGPMLSLSARYGPARTGVGAYALGPTVNLWITRDAVTVCAPVACPGTLP